MSGHIITIFGAKDGLGKSVLAANIAFAYASELKQKVLLLDFDQRACGDQTIITGIKSKKSLKELSRINGTLDSRILGSFVGQHKAGVSHVSMDSDPIQSTSVDPEGMGKVLKSAKSIFPVTVIDAGSELTELSVKALEQATLILLVVTPDILAINQTRKLLVELMGLMIPKDVIQVVYNQVQKGHPVTTDIASKQLGKTIFSMVPKDDATCAASVTRKIPAVILSKGSAYSSGVINLVKKVKAKNILQILEKLNRPTISLDKKSKSRGKSKSGNSDKWNFLKQRILRGIVEEMDLQNKSLDEDENTLLILKDKTKKKIVELLGKEETGGVVSGRDQMNQIVKEILDEALGLGPLEDLLSDPSISEIMVVGPKKIYYEQNGKNKLSDVTFTSDKQVLRVIEKIVYPIGRRIDEKTPYVDARLLDGSRVHAVIPPCAIDGCTITIRKFPENRLTYKDFIKFGSLTEEMADFLRVAVESGKNIVVSGGTGSGKTSLINVLCSFIPANERIITCEDSAELDLPQEHVVRLETRPPNLEGDGEISIRTLVKQTLRMKPDRIIVGECRGGEALDMLQAMNTGHDGSMTSVHSNSPRDCMGRLETLIQYAGSGLAPKAIKEMIASAVDMVIQQTRLEDGSRKIMKITEVAGIQGGDVITLQDIFVFNQEGIDKNGRVTGKFQATGFIPKFVEELERKGYKIPRGIFQNKG